MNDQQEEKVLQTFKWKELYASNLEDMFLIAYDCNLTVEELEINLNKINNELDILKKEILQLELELKNSKDKNEELSKKLELETKRKKRWRLASLIQAAADLSKLLFKFI